MKQYCTKKQSLSAILIGLGAALLLSAAGLLFHNQWLSYQAGLESQTAVAAVIEDMPYGAEIIQPILAPEVIEPVREVAMQEPEQDGALYMGLLTLPTLERVLPVQDSWNLPQLKRSPCRYSGSLTDGRLVIAAHNYKTHFAGLATLSQGDPVIFTDLEGHQTIYEVREICTVETADIDGMVNSGYDLSLFTCNYGGKARIAVRCNKTP